MVDHADRQAFNTLFGEQLVGSRRPDVLVQFQYGISANDVTTTTTGTGAASASEAVATLTTGATTGAASITSNKTLRYQPGYDGIIFFTGAFSTADAGTYQRIGLFDDQNGIWLGQEDGVFKIGLRYGGADTTKTVTLPLGFEPTALVKYRLNYGWLGIAPIVFEAWCSQRWQVIGIFDLTHQQDTVSFIQPVQPVRAEVGRTSGSGSVTLKSASWSAGRISVDMDSLPSDRHGAADGTKTIVADTETNILTLRNKSTFQGQTNRIAVHLDYFSVSAEGTKPAVFRLRHNATLGGTPSYADFDTAKSVIEYDTAGTTVTGGVPELPISIGKSGEARGFIRDLGIVLMPGESVTLSVESTGASDVLGALRWHEEF